MFPVNKHKIYIVNKFFAYFVCGVFQFAQSSAPNNKMSFHKYACALVSIRLVFDCQFAGPLKHSVEQSSLTKAFH